MSDAITSLDAARAQDAADPLRAFRDEFHLPPGPDGTPAVYLCGNSLGLQPKGVRAVLEQELDDWARLGVEGHFKGAHPWYSYDEPLLASAADVVGARPSEVALMGSLTTNLHLLMVSFYRPTARRFQILTEAGPFPSDRYAVASQARFHGYDPADAIVETDDALGYLAKHGDHVALVLYGGVNFYTGRAFDLVAITAAGHAAGAVVGFDLAHAAGNVQLALHDAGADFAAWCSYKYLNSGPGGVAGIFVHERHATNEALPRFTGWWGTDPATRFDMAPTFTPQAGAGGWQLSNVPVFSLAPCRVALDQFTRAGMPALRAKSVAMTAALLQALDRLPGGGPQILTPRDARARGGQLSLCFPGRGRAVNAALTAAGVVSDYRDPDVVRIAVAPLYTSYEDLWRFVRVLSKTLGGVP